MGAIGLGVRPIVFRRKGLADGRHSIPNGLGLFQKIARLLRTFGATAKSLSPAAKAAGTADAGVENIRIRTEAATTGDAGRSLGTLVDAGPGLDDSSLMLRSFFSAVISGTVRTKHSTGRHEHGNLLSEGVDLFFMVKQAETWRHCWGWLASGSEDIEVSDRFEEPEAPKVPRAPILD